MGNFRILVGDITSDELLKGHDLIVNPSNPAMLSGSGVSGAIFKKADVDKLEEYTQKEFNINYLSKDFNRDNLMKTGDIRITPGFNLNMDIMFVQGPKKWDSDDSLDILKKTYNNMFNEIEKNKYKNILMPSLGTGFYGFGHVEVGKFVPSMIREFVKDKDINVDLVLYSDEDSKYYE